MSFSFNHPPTVSLTVPITVPNGGTNIQSYSVGDILYASGSTTLSKLASGATGTSLVSNGPSTAPSYQALPLSGATGVLAVVNGGSGQSTLGSGQVLMGNGTSPVTGVTISTNTVFGAGGFGVPASLAVLPIPVQQAITDLSTVTTGTWNATPIASSYVDSTLTSKTFAGNTNLSTGTASQLVQTDASKNLISMGTTLPSNVQDNITRTGTITSGTWTGTAVASGNIASTLSGKTLTTATLNNPTFSGLGGALGGASVLATLNSNQIVARDITQSVNKLTILEGGTSSITALGNTGIMISSGPNGAIVQGATGTGHQLLHGDLSWGTVDLASEVGSSLLPYGNGGIGVSSTPSNGKIPIGNGSGYTVANLTAGANITINNSAGGIEIVGTGGGFSATEYTTPGTSTYNVPSGAKWLNVSIIGAGGAGGNGYYIFGSNNSGGGGGGGAGCYRNITVPVQGATACTFLIGGGGTASNSMGQNGGGGNYTSFAINGNTIYAGAGAGGRAGATSASGAGGGSAGGGDATTNSAGTSTSSGQYVISVAGYAGGASTSSASAGGPGGGAGTLTTELWLRGGAGGGGSSANASSSAGNGGACDGTVYLGGTGDSGNRRGGGGGASALAVGGDGSASFSVTGGAGSYGSGGGGGHGGDSAGGWSKGGAGGNGYAYIQPY